MTHKHHAHRPTGAVSQSALILSLISALPNPNSPLGRKARTLAHRLSEGRATGTDLDAAAAVLSQLLSETDAGLPIDDDGLLDSGFDS